MLLLSFFLEINMTTFNSHSFGERKVEYKIIIIEFQEQLVLAVSKI